MPNTDIVRASVAAYIAGNQAVADRLLADDFVFTRPQDDHIDKPAYLERCFPTAGRFTSQEILYAVSVSDDDVFLLYEYELQDGARYRNAELVTVREEKIVETQVFFGGRVGS